MILGKSAYLKGLKRRLQGLETWTCQNKLSTASIKAVYKKGLTLLLKIINSKHSIGTLKLTYSSYLLSTHLLFIIVSIELSVAIILQVVQSSI